MASEALQDAVIRNVEVIGEAAKRVSAESRGRLASLDWKSICGMRDGFTITSEWISTKSGTSPLLGYSWQTRVPVPRRSHDIPRRS